MSVLINRKNKWAFIHIPKTGGTSIAETLKKEEGTEQLTGHDSIRILEDVSDYFIFTFVRNPYTRIASAYSHEKRKSKVETTFSEFLKNTNPNHLWVLSQNYYVNEGKSENKKISFVGRYENFDNDLKFILNKLNIKAKIPHLNRNPIYDRHPNLKQENYYKFFYTEEWMKNLVEKRYKDDFKIFNYVMEL